MIRKFVFSGKTDRNKSGHVAKFWNIELDSLTVRTHYGVVGTNGRSIVKDFPSSADAAGYFEGKIAEKAKEGYSEVVEASMQNIVYCTKCGGTMSQDDQFCRACGASVNSRSSIDSSAPNYSIPDPKPKKKRAQDERQSDAGGEELWDSEILMELASASAIGKQLFLEKTTSKSILSRYANNPDDDVRATVGSNVNTASDSLAILAADDDEYVRGAVARNESTPKKILEVLAQDSEYWVRWGVSSNPCTPVEVLKRLAQDDDPSVRGFVADNPNLPVQVVREVIKSLREVDGPSGLENLAENPDTEPVVLEALAEMQSEDIRRQVAGNPSTPAKTLELLSKDDESWVRETVGKNLNTPRKVLEALAADDISEVAENPNCPLPILLAYVNSDEEWLRRRVAENPKLSANLLAQLSNDVDSDVRSEVARNLNTTSKVLSELAEDEESDVREAVAENAKATSEVLRRLSEDPEYSVRREVGANSSAKGKILVQLSEDPEEYVRASVAGNEKTPAQVLERLAFDSEDVVRRSVASNPNTPASTLALLADDTDRDVLCEIARNPQCEPSILESLSSEYGLRLRANLIAHAKLTHDALRNILELLPIYEKVEAKTFNSEAEEIAFARKLLNQYIKSSNKQARDTPGDDQEKRFKVEVILQSQAATWDLSDFDYQLDLQDKTYDDIQTLDDVGELVEPAWRSDYANLVYGSLEGTGEDFRRSSPFGNFAEAEILDVPSHWEIDNYDSDEETFEQRWVFESLQVEVNAIDSVSAMEFVKKNISNCFFVDEGDNLSEVEVAELKVLKTLAD